MMQKFVVSTSINVAVKFCSPCWVSLCGATHRVRRRIDKLRVLMPSTLKWWKGKLIWWARGHVFIRLYTVSGAHAFDGVSVQNEVPSWQLSNLCNSPKYRQPYKSAAALWIALQKKAGNGFTQRQRFLRLAMPLFHGWPDCCHDKGCWSVSQHDFWLAGGKKPFANFNRCWRSFCRAWASVFLVPVK